ncbi:MAG: hypothetical protein A2207_01315 [Candidatus Yanofskybacteria bacterium RIFOXYA1_FULL_44_17]|nr:MAG: hypothetical protein A2207_01315 [Candidatus Yanofskybacteria bacterium RIFOXYA1_FULL_44_17]HBX58494.1 hypothetical protein [Candidatus Yanofskybacteria bacterium]
MVANLELNEENLIITWKRPFDLIAKRPFPSNGRAHSRWCAQYFLAHARSLPLALIYGKLKQGF